LNDIKGINQRIGRVKKKIRELKKPNSVRIDHLRKA